jgi:flagellar motility protein MotE (MotC chaperone)
MRVIKGVVLLAFGIKVMVLGLWCWDSVAHAERPTKGADAVSETALVPADLLARSRGFHDLLDAVRQRGQELDEREQAVKARAAAVDALEKTVAEEVARLEALVGGKGGPAPAGEAAAAPAVAADITKIYESMKAEEAAPILDRLDDETAKAILGRMKQKQIGAILAAMNRDRAVALTKALAGGS